MIQSSRVLPKRKPIILVLQYPLLSVLPFHVSSDEFSVDLAFRKVAQDVGAEVGV